MYMWIFSDNRDTDFGEDDSSGVRFQPDHFPNTLRPGGGYHKDTIVESDTPPVFCNKCDDEIVDGSCLRCDWGEQNRAVPMPNYPLDPFEDDKAGIRAGSWKFAMPWTNEQKTNYKNFLEKEKSKIKELYEGQGFGGQRILNTLIEDYRERGEEFPFPAKTTSEQRTLIKAISNYIKESGFVKGEPKSKSKYFDFIEENKKRIIELHEKQGMGHAKIFQQLAKDYQEAGKKFPYSSEDKKSVGQAIDRLLRQLKIEKGTSDTFLEENKDRIIELANSPITRGSGGRGIFKQLARDYEKAGKEFPYSMDQEVNVGAVIDRYLKKMGIERGGKATKYFEFCEENKDKMIELRKDFGLGGSAIFNQLAKDYEESGKDFPFSKEDKRAVGVAIISYLNTQGIEKGKKKKDELSSWEDVSQEASKFKNSEMVDFIRFWSEEMQADLYEDSYEPFFEGTGAKLWGVINENDYVSFSEMIPDLIWKYNVQYNAEDYVDDEYITNRSIKPKAVWNHFRKTLGLSNKRQRQDGESTSHVLYVITSPVAIKIGITGLGFKNRLQGYKQQNRRQFKDNPEWQWHTDPTEQREIPAEAPGGQSTLFFDEQFDPDYLNEFYHQDPYRRNRKIVRSSDESSEAVHYISLEMNKKTAEIIEARIMNWLRDDCGIQTSPIGEDRSFEDRKSLPYILTEKGEEQDVLHMCESIPLQNGVGVTPELIAYFIGIMANGGGRVPDFGEGGQEWLQSNFNISDENFAQMFSGQFGQELGVTETPVEVGKEQIGQQTADPNTFAEVAQQPQPQYPNQMPLWEWDEDEPMSDWTGFEENQPNIRAGSWKFGMPSGSQTNLNAPIGKVENLNLSEVKDHTKEYILNLIQEKPNLTKLDFIKDLGKLEGNDWVANSTIGKIIGYSNVSRFFQTHIKDPSGPYYDPDYKRADRVRRKTKEQQAERIGDFSFVTDDNLDLWKKLWQEQGNELTSDQNQIDPNPSSTQKIQLFCPKGHAVFVTINQTACAACHKENRNRGRKKFHSEDNILYLIDENGNILPESGKTLIEIIKEFSGDGKMGAAQIGDLISGRDERVNSRGDHISQIDPIYFAPDPENGNKGVPYKITRATVQRLINEYNEKQTDPDLQIKEKANTDLNEETVVYPKDENGKIIKDKGILITDLIKNLAIWEGKPRTLSFVYDQLCQRRKGAKLVIPQYFREDGNPIGNTTVAVLNLANKIGVNFAEQKLMSDFTFDTPLTPKIDENGEEINRGTIGNWIVELVKNKDVLSSSGKITFSNILKELSKIDNIISESGFSLPSQKQIIRNIINQGIENGKIDKNTINIAKGSFDAEEESYLYVFKHGDSIKIGITNDIEERVKQLARGLAKLPKTDPRAKNMRVVSPINIPIDLDAWHIKEAQFPTDILFNMDAAGRTDPNFRNQPRDVQWDNPILRYKPKSLFPSNVPAHTVNEMMMPTMEEITDDLENMRLGSEDAVEKSSDYYAWKIDEGEGSRTQNIEYSIINWWKGLHLSVDVDAANHTETITGDTARQNLGYDLGNDLLDINLYVLLIEGMIANGGNMDENLTNIFNQPDENGVTGHQKIAEIFENDPDKINAAFGITWNSETGEYEWGNDFGAALGTPNLINSLSEQGDQITRERPEGYVPTQRDVFVQQPQVTPVEVTPDQPELPEEALVSDPNNQDNIIDPDNPNQIDPKESMWSGF